MRRLLPLLLLAVPALCWAAASSESETAPKNGACVYARPAVTATVAEADAPQARPAIPPAARSTPKPAATGGGGGDGDAVVPRGRGNRWHSFLPGMFR
ncbi:hypothetical protein MNQ95_09300 [Pseudoxanthomonas daejeonensis]|uniref:Secreted protein n=1 Tax=Pseudoxanthomonas daejeonensis TaxID=266062 RepID=A0ABQ6ZBB4_9GAMM|nr:hypothetical protein [Pseudoxanthomonas daejeonensis]KAF1697073.1 hypothetical protein CSC65_03010 [Pseudoxanthomonas daejeonensis]UNK56368.1 hypothetical protein MNQ95_09300 [Pseudoxanthomonas daejeonensis]